MPRCVPNNPNNPSILHFIRFLKGNFLWPGFGENIRVLDWIQRRASGKDVNEDIAVKTPVGFVPKPGAHQFLVCVPSQPNHKT